MYDPPVLYILIERGKHSMNEDNQPICETDKFGTKRWYLNNQFHRENGPAVEYADGTKIKCWYLHDQRHRLDGPAVEYANDSKYWYYHGEWINCSSQEEFERLIKLKVLW